MIIVRLMGGLGNQLFQYAAGRRLAHKHNTMLKLDLSAYARDDLRSYALHPFNIRENIASVEDISHFNPDGRLKRLISRVTGRPLVGCVFYARDFIFEAGILDAPADLHMIGYWQSEKYFKDIESILRDDLIINVPQDVTDREIAAVMENTESVSLHVRRADYVNDSRTNRRYGTCDPGYYRRCAEYVAAHTDSPHFFVFSDDMAWARENIKLSFPTTFVGHNDDAKNYQDLRLMSLCRHNIIANSSFSWWGAWLNSNPDKLVLAPRKWLADPENEPEEIIPAEWTKI